MNHWVDRLSWYARGKPLRRDEPVAALHEGCDLVPIAIAVEPHADPALGAEIGRHEETLGIGADEDLLAAVRYLAPDSVALIDETIRREDAVLDPVARAAPHLFLHGLGEREADLPEPHGR